MRKRYGAKAFLKALVDQAPTLAIELPSLPEAVASAIFTVGQLERLAHEQRETIDRLANAIDGQNRHTRWRRVAGAALIVAGVGILWQPLVGLIADRGDSLSITAGVAAALAGSLLVVRG